jgi:hypothetical protein
MVRFLQDAIPVTAIVVWGGAIANLFYLNLMKRGEGTKEEGPK